MIFDKKYQPDLYVANLLPILEKQNAHGFSVDCEDIPEMVKLLNIWIRAGYTLDDLTMNEDGQIFLMFDQTKTL